MAFHRFISRSSGKFRNVFPLLGSLILCAVLPSSAQVAAKAVASPSKDDVLTVMGHKELVHDPNVQFKIKPWNVRPGSFVALVYLSMKSDAMDVGDGDEIVRAGRLEPTVALLEYVQGHLVATAQSDGLKGLGTECRDASDVMKEAGHTPDNPAPFPDGRLCQEFDFDLAPYRLTPTVTAIGIRTKYHEIYAAGEGDYEDLTLFEPAGHRLIQVFSEEMSGSSEERGPNEMLTSKTTLQVSPQKTRDHFDLVLTEHDRTERLVDDPSAGHPGKSLSKHRFTWNGTAYTEAK